MSQIINTPVFFNNVPEQRLTYANQLTVTAWNDIINTLRTQANAVAMYIKRLDYWFLDENNPDSWYARVEQHLTQWQNQLSLKVNIGTDTDTYNIISYYGLKNKIDEMADILYVLNERPFEEIWYTEDEPDTSIIKTWVVDLNELHPIDNIEQNIIPIATSSFTIPTTTSNEEQTPVLVASSTSGSNTLASSYNTANTLASTNK